MQRQPESSNLLSSEMAATNSIPSRANSITIDCLSADLYKDVLQMSLSASCDSFGGIVLDDGDDLVDDDDRKLPSTFFPLKKRRSSIARRRSSALMHSIESFACSFSSLMIDVEQPSSSNTMEKPSLVTDEDPLVDDDDVAAVNAEAAALIEEAESSAPTSSAVSAASSPSPSPDVPVSLMVSSVPPPQPISITSSSRSSSSSCSSYNSDDSDTTKKATKKTAKNTAMKVSTLAGEVVVEEKFSPFDVVCGRNSKGHELVGNRRFQISIQMNVDRYIAAPSREGKTRVVQQLYNTLINEVGCRFLKKTGKDQFVEMDKKAIKEKIGHSFRDLTNLKRKQQKTDKK